MSHLGLPGGGVATSNGITAAIAVIFALSSWFVCSMAGAAMPARAIRWELNRTESLLRHRLAKLPVGSGVEIIRESERVILRLPARLLFAPDSEELKQDPAAALALSVTAQLLRARRRLTARIEVYTDNIGGASLNQGLSEQRARAVLAALTAAGVAGQRLQAHGAGLTAALASNDTPEGRMQNRRVEIVFERARRAGPMLRSAREPLRPAPVATLGGA